MKAQTDEAAFSYPNLPPPDAPISKSVIIFDGNPIYYGRDQPKLIAEELVEVIKNLNIDPWNPPRVRVIVEVVG